jgi:hypothetical protein
LGAPFSRYRPAEYLLRNNEELLGRLSRDALGRFVALFERVNRVWLSKQENGRAGDVRPVSQAPIRTEPVPIPLGEP